MYGYHYLSGLLRIQAKRTIAEISRVAGVSYQNMHHYISKSPWSGPELIKQVRSDVVGHEHFSSGSILIGDESADDRCGKVLVGGSRQYNGRLGKVDECQVGVYISIAKDGKHNWLNGELFVPEAWFSEENAELRERVGIPAEREFKTKIELFWQMVQSAMAEGIPFDGVAVDSLYGRSAWLRNKMDKAALEYYADIPANTKVYLSEPKIGVPKNKRGPKAKKSQVLSPFFYQVRDLRNHPSMHWHTLRLRTTERGWLEADFARLPVWFVDDDMAVTKEWLLIRRNGSKHSYSFSNASQQTSLQLMALRKTQRYFIERDNQDAKSDFGWDEIETVTFKAWEHQLAFTILAQWFINRIRLDWEQAFLRDPLLLDYYRIDSLPSLSVANVCLLLRAAIPLPILSTLEAALQIIEHFDNRIRSRRSRITLYAEP